MSFRRTVLIDSLILVCFTVVLIKPLFRLKYIDNWPSIESTFIADARMLSEHLPHQGWQPLWYCGTRTDYIYPPALRYGTVLIMKTGHVLPVRAYHLFIAIFYVVGVATVYLLVRIGSGSRGSAWISAVGTALVSPSFLLLKQIRHDSGFWTPQRLHALMTYGEGPHISALCIIPAALAAVFAALRARRPAMLAVAGVLCALVVATNFYGATALAILYPVAVWSVWNGERKAGILWRAAAIPILAYGLSAFWLTPSYLEITLTDLKWVAQPGNTHSRIVALFGAGLYCYLTWRFASRQPKQEWRVFVAGAAFFFALYVLGYYFFGVRVTGDAARLIPELDLALILVFAEIIREMWLRPRLRTAAGLLVVIAFLPAIRYLRHAWSPFPKSPPLETIYEYRVSQWVHDHLPGERVLPVGSIRFWFDAWADNPQPDGGSSQGMLNQMLPAPSWQILHTNDAATSVLWLKALGTDAAIVPDKTAPEFYHDYADPTKFRGVLPVTYDDGKGTRIYGVPRVHPGIIRIVGKEQMAKITSSLENPASLKAYVAAIEDPSRAAAAIDWHDFDEADVRATTGPGESVLFQETWDPSWHAYENGRAIPIRVEPLMDFMLIDAGPGAHEIRLRFETPLENRVGQVLSMMTLVILVGLVLIDLRRAPSRGA